MVFVASGNLLWGSASGLDSFFVDLFVSIFLAFLVFCFFSARHASSAVPEGASRWEGVLDYLYTV